MDEEVIQGLEFSKDANGTMKPVPYSQRQVLSLFLLYLDHRDSVGTSVQENEWDKLTSDDFDDFCTSPVGLSYQRRRHCFLKSPPLCRLPSTPTKAHSNLIPPSLSSGTLTKRPLVVSTPSHTSLSASTTQPTDCPSTKQAATTTPKDTTPTVGNLIFPPKALVESSFDPVTLPESLPQVAATPDASLPLDFCSPEKSTAATSTSSLCVLPVHGERDPSQLLDQKSGLLQTGTVCGSKEQSFQEHVQSPTMSPTHGEKEHLIASSPCTMDRGIPTLSSAYQLEWHGFLPDTDDPGGPSTRSCCSTSLGHQNYQPCYQQRYGELCLSFHNWNAMFGHLVPVISDDSTTRLWGAQELLLLVSNKWGVTISQKYYSRLTVLMETSIVFSLLSLEAKLLTSTLYQDSRKAQKQTTLPRMTHPTVMCPASSSCHVSELSVQYTKPRKKHGRYALDNAGLLAPCSGPSRLCRWSILDCRFDRPRPCGMFPRPCASFAAHAVLLRGPQYIFYATKACLVTFAPKVDFIRISLLVNRRAYNF